MDQPRLRPLEESSFELHGDTNRHAVAGLDPLGCLGSGPRFLRIAVEEILFATRFLVNKQEAEKETFASRDDQSPAAAAVMASVASRARAPSTQRHRTLRQVTAARRRG